MIGVTSFVEMARIDPTGFDGVMDLGVQPYAVFYDSAGKQYKRLTNSTTQTFAGLMMGLQNCDNCLGRVVFDGIIEMIVPDLVTPFLVADSTYYLQANGSLSTTVSAYKIGYTIRDTFDGSNNINFVLDVKATWWYADNVLALAKSYADSLVVGLYDLRGSYNASTNLYPTTGGSGPAGAVKKADVWHIGVAGTLGGKIVTVGDTLVALIDTPGQTSGNWLVGETNFDFVPEPTITPGTASQFRRGDKTRVDFATTVRSAVITGVSFVTATAILATDTVLVALGKLQKQITDLGTSKANLASPAITGTPTAPTAVAGTNTTQIATTAHVFAERSNTVTLTNKTLTAPTLTSPIITGSLTLNSVDITSAWTSRTLTTPTSGGSITSTQYAKYRIIGKTLHFAIKAIVAQTGSFNFFEITPPVSVISGFQGGCGTRWFSGSRLASGGFIESGRIYIQGGSTLVGDIRISGTYEIA